MRIAIAVLMAIHGVAHLPGFVVPWRLATLEGMPYRTTALAGSVDLGDAGARAVGVLWLLTAVAFWVAAAGAALDSPWWGTLALGAALGSLMLCAIGWPDARVGVPVNLLIVTALVLGRRSVWA